MVPQRHGVEALQPAQNGAKADDPNDIERPGLQTRRQLRPGRALEAGAADHVAAAMPGARELEQLAAAVEDADARGTKDLMARERVEIGAEGPDVDAAVGHSLGAIDEHLGADGVGHRRHRRDGMAGAEGVAHLGDRHQARPPTEQRRVGVEIELQPTNAQLTLPRGSALRTCALSAGFRGFCGVGGVGLGREVVGDRGWKRSQAGFNLGVG